MSETPAASSTIVLGVAGGIAAYKAAELLRRFTEGGHDVTVVPTPSALHFVGAATWAALSGKPVTAEVWESVHEVPHVRIGQSADLVVVAPATADLLARAAHGRADDLLTNVLLTARCPVVFVPAMHTEMWEHAATRANVATLRERGALVIEPSVGRLTGADSGKGRLPDPDEIFAVCQDVLAHGIAETDLAGRTVVVSAGGTREPLDPVRFLGNRSSGRQGVALARAAVVRGAEVTLVAANVTLPDPAGVKVVRVETTEELRDAVVTAASSADVVVMAAAPADFRPVATTATKIKKSADGSAPDLELTQTPDILAEISHDRLRPGQVVVGFAAETGDDSGSVLELGRAKLARKGCDLLVVNDVGGGAVFGADDNQAVILGADGARVDVPTGPKAALAHTVWDEVVRRLEPAIVTADQRPAVNQEHQTP
jgi:phosphopantothenoylcysteine decarboxylase/phosphopantothenate--cysteine ligase